MKRLLWLTMTILSIFFIGCSKDKKILTKPTVFYVLKDSNGYFLELDKNLSNDFFKNKVILFFLFSANCQPCEIELPYLIDIQKSFPKKLKVIAISLSKPYPTKEFLKHFETNFFVSISKDNQKVAEIIYHKFKRKNFPLPFIAVWKNSSLDSFYEGVIPEEMLKEEIKNLTGE